MNPIRCAVSLASVCLLLVAGLRAQQPAAPSPAPAAQTASRQILLPVTVRDKHGFVQGLGPKDITLSEDGHPQTVLGFTRDSKLPFRVGLLVDTSRGLSSALDAERKAAAKFVDLLLPAEPLPGNNADQIFLIHFDTQVELLRDFTGSRDKLHRELDEMSTSRETRRASSSRNDEQGGPGGGSGGEPGGNNRMGSTTQLYDAIFLAADELMKSIQGRKSLVLFSDGVDRNSKETLNDAIDAADRAGLSVYTIYLKGEEQRSGGGAPGSGGNQGSNRRGGIGWPGSGGGWPGGNSGGGYPGGSGGGGRGDNRDKIKVDGKKILEQIATRTGGRFFEAKKKDNLEEIYTQVLDELRNQYLLTYAPAKPADGQYHKLQLKGRKDDWSISAREGYYADEK